jgi:hypothetical protein
MGHFKSFLCGLPVCNGLCVLTWTKKECKFYLKPHPGIPVIGYLTCLQNGFKKEKERKESFYFVVQVHSMRLL